MNSRKRNDSDDLEYLQAKIRNDRIKSFLTKSGKNLNHARNMCTRIWNQLLRTVYKIIMFIGLFKKDRNQQQVPCTIRTITQNQ